MNVSDLCVRCYTPRYGGGPAISRPLVLEGLAETKRKRVMLEPLTLKVLYGEQQKEVQICKSVSRVG